MKSTLMFPDLVDTELWLWSVYLDTTARVPSLVGPESLTWSLPPLQVIDISYTTSYCYIAWLEKDVDAGPPFDQCLDAIEHFLCIDM